MSRLACVILFLLSFLGVAAQAEPRTALVIGNAAYSYGKLANAVNDANDVAAALQADGFEVILKTDADQQGMDAAVGALGEKLKAKGGVGFFYFSGHGVQVGGENYILPIGDAPAREGDVKYKAINVAQVVDAMAGNELNIIVLDSCRNNPLSAGARSATRGLARVEGGSGLFVSFATSPGAVALDGEGRNSPYTSNLVAALRTPGLTLEETFKRTLKAVHQETKGQQTPWISSSFFGDFVFLQAGATQTAAASPPATPPAAVEPATPQPDTKVASARQVPSTPPALGGLYRVAGINPNGSRYAGMVAVTRSGTDYAFDWWIGAQNLKGIGHFAGRMLVVEWGEPHPVIYALDGNGSMSGEWADNSATETLSLYAPATDYPTVGGAYAVTGKNEDGSTYSGTVRITGSGASYRVDWNVGGAKYRGKGVLKADVLTVDWGRPAPAVYALQADGSLVGLWSGGAGEETLAPE
jgi:hypothetical protein